MARPEPKPEPPRPAPQVQTGNPLAANGYEDREKRLIRTIWFDRSVVESVAFSPDAKTIVSGSADNKVRIWDVGTGNIKFTLEEHWDWVKAVAFFAERYVRCFWWSR